MKRIILTAILILASAGSSHAQSSDAALAGIGMISCGKYLAQRSDHTFRLMTISWAQGFLSGMNMADYTTSKRPFVLLPDDESITAYIDEFCRKYPLESPAMGATRLYNEIRANNRR